MFRYLMVVICFFLAAPVGAMATSHAASGVDASGPLVRLPGHVLPALAKATVEPGGKAKGEEPLTLTVVLKRDDQAGFERYLHDVYDLHSKIYKHFLSQKEIAKRFGPSQEHYDSVLRYLKQNGFELVEGSANRLTLTVNGNRVATERMFDIHLRDYEIGDKRFFANDADPSLPEQLASHVEAVAGLSNLANISVQHGPSDSWLKGLKACANNNDVKTNGGGGAQILCGLGYSIVGFVYDLLCIDANFWTLGHFNCTVVNLNSQASNSWFVSQAYAAAGNVTAITGAGQKIGLLEFDSFHSSDVSDFLALVGAPRV